MCIRDSFKSDPYGYLRQLRKHNDNNEIVPSARREGAYVVMSYSCAKQVMLDAELSARFIPSAVQSIADSEIPNLTCFGQQALPFTDQPQHRRLRKLLMGAFSRKILDSFNEEIEQLISDILDDVTTEQPVDVVDLLAEKISVTVISRLLGIFPHQQLSLIHISEPTRRYASRMPSSA